MKWFRKLRRWLSNTFRSNPVKKPTKTPTPRVNPHLDEKLRFGMIVPHTKKAQGAVSSTNITEYVYGSLLAVSIFKDLTRFATRNQAGVKGAVKHLVKTGHNASFEPHLNAFNHNTSGFEVLVIKGDYESAEYALNFLDLMEKHFPTKNNRGIKYVSKGDNGYYNLATARRSMKVAILTEAFFIDNDRDWISVDKMADIWKEFLNE